METEEVDVMFRVHRQGSSDVFALFPGIAGSVYRSWECCCYQHVGQHCSADLTGCIQASRPAKPEEYASLLDELKRIGYVPRIVRRQTATHRQAREAQLREVCNA